MEVQTIVSRILDPALPGVVTVGVLNAGNAANVIPEVSRCAGTIRATTPATRTLATVMTRNGAPFFSGSSEDMQAGCQ